MLFSRLGHTLNGPDENLSTLFHSMAKFTSRRARGERRTNPTAIFMVGSTPKRDE